MATFGAATMKGHLKVLQFLQLVCRPKANGWLERYVVRCGLHRPVVKELRNICSPPGYWFDRCVFARDCLVSWLRRSKALPICCPSSRSSPIIFKYCPMCILAKPHGHLACAQL